ncbi:MAG: winged helix-turn-helix domain-containing protein [Dehalococcoidia bacterium]
MRVLVLAENAAAAEAYAALLRAQEHEVWVAVGSAPAAALARESNADVMLAAIDDTSAGLRRVIARVRGALERDVPVVLALSDSSWWLRAPPGDLSSVAVLHREGLTARAIEGTFERLGLAPASVHDAPLALDGARRQLTGPTGTVRLTPTEGAIARALLDAIGATVSVEVLCAAAWPGAPIDAHRIVALRTHMYGLRRKLGAVGARDALATEPGRGYRLVPP